jgi:glucuronate isomerase
MRVKKVCSMANIQHVVQNIESQVTFPQDPDLGLLVPCTINDFITEFLDNPNQDTLAKCQSRISNHIDQIAKNNVTGVRVDYNLFESDIGSLWRDSILDAIFSSLNEHEMFVQIFMGMTRNPQGSYPQSDPCRITSMYRYFRANPDCRFELVSAASGDCLDVVQAAVSNINVMAGGLWWYNFRPSIFLQSMQYRLEALPATKCPIVATDATHIEWCYGKVMLIKKLIAELMADQVEKEWITEDCAIQTAKIWLYDAAASYYIK